MLRFDPRIMYQLGSPVTFPILVIDVPITTWSDSAARSVDLEDVGDIQTPHLWLQHEVWTWRTLENRPSGLQNRSGQRNLEHVLTITLPAHQIRELSEHVGQVWVSS